jgi:hypothetical protein
VPARRPLVRRRTALCTPLAGLAAAVLAAGCDNGDEIAPTPSSGAPSGATATAGATEDQRSPDQVLVDDVLAGLTGAIEVLAQARKAPAIRAYITPLLKAHRRHVEVLEGELSNPPPAGPSPDPDAMLRLVRRHERDLHVTLVDAAGRAESGALARLLASMSASVTQHLTLLPTKDAS